jgi:biopolymer transport protein ExbB/TolQ
MIRAFQNIERLGNLVQPADIGRGIYEALICTLMGLSLAVVALTVFIVFRNKVQRVVADANTVVWDMMDRFRPSGE